MERKKILFISGSLGLGHIFRDLAIANELRNQNPNIEISWLAAHPATQVILNAGETLLPEAEKYANDNLSAEQSARGNSLNLLKYLTKASKAWKVNFEIFKKVTSENEFDLVIGDETYEIVVGLGKDPKSKKAPFIIIYDFIGLDAMTSNPLELLGTYLWNRVWSIDFKKGRAPSNDLALFIGELDDVPNKKFGFMLPNRRVWAQAMCDFVGFILPFNPAEFNDKEQIRHKLGYRNKKLILCSIGGTSIGKNMLELCGQAFKIINKKRTDIDMTIVCGPRLSPDSLNIPEEIEIKKFVPNLYEHFAASDLTIVQGGATSTLELTALNKPFIFFPIEGHFEQANVAKRQYRYQAGVKMSYPKTTPEILADEILKNLNKKVNYPKINVEGAKNASKSIMEILYP